MSCLDSSIRWKSVPYATPYSQSYTDSVAELSDQFGKKNLAAEEKIWPP